MSYNAPRGPPQGSRLPMRRTQTTTRTTPSETSVTTVTTVTQSRPSSSNVGQSGLRQPGFQRPPGVCPGAMQPPRQPPRQPPSARQTMINKTSSTSISQGRKKVVSTTRIQKGPAISGAGGSRSSIPSRSSTPRVAPPSRGVCPAAVTPGHPGTSGIPRGPARQQYGPAAPTQMRSRIAMPSRLPQRGSQQAGPLGPIADKTVLERKVERELYRTASRSPGQIVTATGGKKSAISPPMMMTPTGPVMAQDQVTMERIVERSPGSEKISRHMVGIEKQGCCRAIRTEVDSQRLEPGGISTGPGSPLREVISISSSVTVSPQGLKEKTSTVIYEKTAPVPEGPSPAQISKLVAEETLDVNKAMRLTPLELKVLSPTSYGIKKREHEMLINKTSVGRLEQSVRIPEPCADREQEELQPEMMATIMHTEEQGIAMGAQPTQIYDYLFPEAKEPEVIEVSSVVPAPLQDVMVPVELPENFYASAMSQDLEQAILNAEQAGGTKPTGNVFTENVVRPDKDRRPVVKNVAKRAIILVCVSLICNLTITRTAFRRQRSKPAPQSEGIEILTKCGKRKLTEIPVLAEELPPWGIEDLQPIIDLVGAVPNTTLIANLPEDASTSIRAQEKSQGFEYMLQMEPPSHASRVQLRGSQRPPWFPGYMVAFPDIPDLIQIVNDPSAVLSTAWRAVQPKNFMEESFLVI